LNKIFSQILSRRLELVNKYLLILCKSDKIGTSSDDTLLPMTPSKCFTITPVVCYLKELIL